MRWWAYIGSLLPMALFRQSIIPPATGSTAYPPGPRFLFTDAVDEACHSFGPAPQTLGRLRADAASGRWKNGTGDLRHAPRGISGSGSIGRIGIIGCTDRSTRTQREAVVSWFAQYTPCVARHKNEVGGTYVRPRPPMTPVPEPHFLFAMERSLPLVWSASTSNPRVDSY
jgi:hypothetical protein